MIVHSGLAVEFNPAAVGAVSVVAGGDNEPRIMVRAWQDNEWVSLFMGLAEWTLLRDAVEAALKAFNAKKEGDHVPSVSS